MVDIEQRVDRLESRLAMLEKETAVSLKDIEGKINCVQQALKTINDNVVDAKEKTRQKIKDQLWFAGTFIIFGSILTIVIEDGIKLILAAL